MTKSTENRIVVIGGGTGAPTVNEALVIAGYHPTDIVAVSDDGGITGRMRTDSRGQEIAVSDAFRCMLSLVDQQTLEDPRVQAALKPLLIRTSIRHLGYEIVDIMSENVTVNGFNLMQDWLSQLTGKPLLGKVLPVTTCPTNIIATTISGRRLDGEHELDIERMSKDTVVNASLHPRAKAFPPAIKALEHSDYIISAFGSLIGSVLINFSVKGIKEAYKNSQARRIYITNLVSTRNETNEFSPEDFINMFRKYTGMGHPLDILIVPSITREEFEKNFKKAAFRYDQQHARFLGWSENQLDKARKTLGIDIITHDAFKITQTPKGDFVARHDPTKLAKTLKAVIN